MKKYVSTLIICLFGLLATSFAQGYEVGDVATGFSLKNIDNKMVGPENYPDAQGFIIVFTCNSCPWANMYEERINALNQKYEPLGYPVLAINPNDPNRQPKDSFDEMVSRAQDKGYSFPYLVDGTQEITSAYGATRTPHTYVVQKNDSDQLIVKYIGAIDDNAQDPGSANTKYVENAVDQIRAGEEVSETFTRAIGCGIKWIQ